MTIEPTEQERQKARELLRLKDDWHDERENDIAQALAEARIPFQSYARSLEESIDKVRDALGLDSTHYLVVADQVGDVVKQLASEREAHRETREGSEAMMRNRDALWNELERIKKLYEEQVSTTIEEQSSAIGELEAELERLKGLLKKLEWVCEGHCPLCGGGPRNQFKTREQAEEFKRWMETDSPQAVREERDRLRAENQELRKALRPFVEYGKVLRRIGISHDALIVAKPSVYASDFYRALDCLQAFDCSPFGG